MKCEQHGKLNLNTKNVKQSRFLNESIIQFQIIFDLIISELASPIEVAFVYLEILIV